VEDEERNREEEDTDMFFYGQSKNYYYDTLGESSEERVLDSDELTVWNNVSYLTKRVSYTKRMRKEAISSRLLWKR
jgi:hypothetical protein